jgi:hypothetical protein
MFVGMNMGMIVMGVIRVLFFFFGFGKGFGVHPCPGLALGLFIGF